VLAVLETGDYRCSAFRIARRAPVLHERASERVGFPLAWEEAAREADYCFRLSLVSEAHAGSSRLDEMDDELDWDAVSSSSTSYTSGLACIWCLALHATGDASGQAGRQAD
jgi:hypothetical protein